MSIGLFSLYVLCSRTQQVVRAPTDNILHYGLQKNDAKKKRSEDYHQSTAQEHKHRPFQSELFLLVEHSQKAEAWKQKMNSRKRYV